MNLRLDTRPLVSSCLSLALLACAAADVAPPAPGDAGAGGASIGSGGAPGGNAGAVDAGARTGGAGGMTPGGAGGNPGQGGAQADGGLAPGGTSGNPAASADCARLPLCDDFEQAGAAPDPARWKVVTPNCSGTGKISIDDTVSARGGRKSVKVVGPSGYCNHVFLANTSDSVVTGIGKTVWGRFYVRFQDALGDGHVTFLAMKDTGDGGKDLRMGGQNGILMWNRESDDATLPALSPAGVAKSLKPTPGQWLCVEFLVDGEAGRLQTWVDGRPIDGLQIDGTPTPDIDDQWLRKANWRPAVTDLKVGFEGYNGGNTLWLDDVALAGHRIGCP